MNLETREGKETNKETYATVKYTTSKISFPDHNVWKNILA